MSEKNESNELDSMTIILHIGNAKSEAYEALKAVKEGDIETFDQKYKLAKNELRIGHRAHAEMLRKLSSEERMKDVDLLMIHAEGHLSSTDIAIDMIGELAELYKWKETINE
ncbi:putative beta-glucoside-specific phosphotransferase system enzyme IIA component [Tetragenococcus halophilus subsp. halophilus]|uniref:Beta-glucoside-specific phosphotransferase system enzyme IIA component n=2 Tax=Tetragenococcus halophilus TaxID=51669 RepID=A0AAN1VQC2_TETHN|nr:PTS lactose/cellobiose transporter subunit IIA [Tetragenococcus halophilus]MDN6571837.1 PTS lactose/cellobiose transporter subunit IIA [Staphylococcus equorum]MDN6735865.1 PTS lactose/cellobiose transporter subunit IIA [Tetragenococcus koreensis]AOF48375.1 PTS sugar transporter subunit IIA [Tetragenococcus halophilus]MCF1685125.1 PTS lactose/cellobiose transporter subunit IIA [Tetragenococcus halophilus]MCO7027423.1 PTS lactose/cellobiose transporter subunit IIA [Tetragenococcus halophilus]